MNSKIKGSQINKKKTIMQSMSCIFKHEPSGNKTTTKHIYTQSETAAEEEKWCLGLAFLR